MLLLFKWKHHYLVGHTITAMFSLNKFKHSRSGGPASCHVPQGPHQKDGNGSCLQLEIAGTLLPPLYTGGLLACELQISSPVRLSMARVLHRKFRKRCQLCLWRFNMLQYLTLTSPGSGPSSRVTDQFSAPTQSEDSMGEGANSWHGAPSSKPIRVNWKTTVFLKLFVPTISSKWDLRHEVAALS